MLKRRFVVEGLSIAIVLGSSVAAAQNYPTKPIRVLASEVGGGGDVTARLLAPDLSVALGQPLVIDNGATALTPDVVAKANPDGYTLAVIAGVAWITPLLRKTTYDTIRDLSPITMLTATPLVVVVHPSITGNSVKDLIALAKAKPGALNYASGPIGGSSHLGAELFKSMAGVDIVGVPYKGSGPGLNALIGGEVQLMINNAGPAMPHVKTGRLKALAITSAKRSELLPGLPTVAETVPGYEYTAIFGVLTTAGTPPAVINKLNHEIVHVLNKPNVKQVFFNGGSEVVGSTPEQFTATIKGEIARLSKVIKDAGIRQE